MYLSCCQIRIFRSLFLFIFFYFVGLICLIPQGKNAKNKITYLASSVSVFKCHCHTCGNLFSVLLLYNYIPGDHQDWGRPLSP